MTCIFAVVAAAMMLAVPIQISISADADFANDKGGFSVNMVNPTDEEIEEYEMGTKSAKIQRAIHKFTDILNEDILSLEEISAGSYVSLSSEGIKNESEARGDIIADEASLEDVKLVFIAEADGPLLDTADLTDDYKAAAKAINEYFGDTVNAGDRITLTGKMAIRDAVQTQFYYTHVDDKHSVAESGIHSAYHIDDINATLGILRADEETGKTIDLVSNYQYMTFYDINFNYKGVKYSDLTEDSPCIIEYGKTGVTFESGKACYKVNDQEYIIKVHGKDAHTEDDTATILTDSEVNLDKFREYIEKIPTSSGNVTVERGYDAAEGPYDAIVIDIATEEVLDILMTLIWVCVAIAAIVAVIIVILIVHKSKKR